MRIVISKKLNDLYTKQHKNFDYAINSALDNFDPETFVDCFDLVKKFDLEGATCEISIGDDIAERIVTDLELDGFDSKKAELLLWIGAILPEV